ncbi:hypothetical protein HBI88_218410 [Parastagonospora nodorum]|nr:hypothetical protein HBI97_230960 [Parastagonospora nodorum]KAH5788816.1 hypothetical protein HBI96_222900 [Parastagonospora nodorum]KAH5800654.1 hypothetical protein HBI94_219320 [Parastagonospora nodorum]KAH5812397.1 hypothetical protein HBI93_218830 [Parastagonospora nodorum]KAH5845770.1 hypothetical protein HBI91_226690 [Parastagonospora nodorum]
MSTGFRPSPPLASDTLAHLLASGALIETYRPVKTCSYPACGATGPSTTLSTLCGHVFHHDCLTKHLERSNNCPHCQTGLSAPTHSASASASDSSSSSSSSECNSEEDAFLHARRKARLETKEIRHSLRKHAKDQKTRKSKSARKARVDEAQEALRLATTSLNNGSRRLHFVAESMQRAAREMDEVTREVQMEKARMREARKRMKERVGTGKVEEVEEKGVHTHWSWIWMN